MSERLKESVLKTEVLIGIPGVRIPLHPRVRTLSPFRYLPLSLYRLGKGRVDYLWELSRRSRWSCDDPNESTIKGAASYISTQIPSPEASRQSHIRKSLSLRYPSVITKHSGPKGIAAIESKPIESETAAVGVTGVLRRRSRSPRETPPQSDLDLTNPDSPTWEGSSPPFVSRLDPPDDLLAEP
ncbi:hypothetical protein Salat_2978400 [Sesamum alatum]|uniref:Uncharacterized protein n=1 Tax=Sesamum alatum TaxID=300844 RepID=A0AAE2C7Y2_9LAMI|nr:hypothetical protein Salat_2978400 [Sesamum alatum]